MVHKSKYPTLYWDTYASNIINKYGLKKTTQGEFHGPCPNCGGVDRFWIKQFKSELRVNCRKCNDWKLIYEELRADDVLPGELNGKDVDEDFQKVKGPQSYDKIKQIELPKGSRLDGNNVVIDIYDPKQRKKVNTQTISPNGFKKFEKGKKTENCCSVINGPIKGTVYLAEGFATAVSVSQATKRPSIFCLSSGNMPKVAEIMKDMYPNVKFIVAADNDSAGIEAAQKCGLLFRAPKKDNQDWNDVYIFEGKGSVKNALTKIKEKKPLVRLIGDFEFKPTQWLIENLVEMNAFAMCFGAPAAGKTFLTLDMALCVATGRAFHENYVAKGTVFYISGEGHNGFARRAAAWCQENDVDIKSVAMFKTTRSVIITDPTAMEELNQIIEDMSDQYGKPKLIVIDTLARAMGASDENSTREVGEAIRIIDDLKDEYECTILAVHHTGHSNKDRARGSSALLGAVDQEFKVEKWGDDEDEQKIEVKFTKMKDAKIPASMNFLHKEVSIINSSNETMTSIVLEPTDDLRSGSGESRSREGDVLSVFRGMKLDTVSRRDLKMECCKLLGKSERTWDRIIQGMIGTVFEGTKHGYTQILTIKYGGVNGGS